MNTNNACIEIDFSSTFGGRDSLTEKGFEGISHLSSIDEKIEILEHCRLALLEKEKGNSEKWNELCRIFGLDSNIYEVNPEGAEETLIRAAVGHYDITL